MGCFLVCFGFKDCSWRKSLLFSRFFLWKKREPVVPRNQYASLVSSKEKATPSKKAEEEIFQECVYQEQRQEAKFRKTSGAILDKRVEIRKASDQHYVVSNACKKIKWDQQHDENSRPPSKVPETSTVSEEKSKSLFSCQLEDHDDKSSKTLLAEEVNHPRVEKELESVTLDMSPQIENQMQLHIGESPYPTPLNLVDGMQTPGTIYPPKSENFRTRMIRTQFAYPIPDLSKSTFELEVVGEGSDNTQKMPDALQNKVSQWLKPPSASGDTKTTMDLGKELSYSYDSPNVDRPIIGAIAVHWDEEAPFCVSRKSCDGNGIPNSTTKYNEDQKVSWHAKPFSLSDEKVLPQEET